MVIEIELFEYADLTPLRIRLSGWMNSEVYRRRVDKCGEVMLGFLNIYCEL